MQVGDSIVQSIQRGRGGADGVIVVLSPAFVKSTWTQAEMNASVMRQFSGHRRKVFPVLLKTGEIPELLHDIHQADFRSSYAAGLKRLLPELAGLNLP